MLFFITYPHQRIQLQLISNLIKMATQQQRQEQQYRELIRKHREYLEMQEEQKQRSWRLKRQMQKVSALGEIVYSSDYQKKIDSAIDLYRQLSDLQKDYQQLLKMEKFKPDQIELVKLQNDRLRAKIDQLNYEIAVQTNKNENFEEQLLLIENYVTKSEQKLQEYQNQIEKLKREEPLKQSVWRKLARQRIENVMAKESPQMMNEQELILLENGCFFKLIYLKAEEVQDLSLKVKENYRILKQKQILSQQLKIQNKIVSKMFRFDTFGQQINTQEDLRAEDEQLNTQLLKRQYQIIYEQEVQSKMRQNLNQLSKDGAIQKTKDYVRQKGVEIKYRTRIVEEALQLIVLGDNQRIHQQAQSMKSQIGEMKQQLDRLEKGIFDDVQIQKQ